MGLSRKQYDDIKAALDAAQRPLYFFHDDADGVCAFLQLYLYKNEGSGVIVKSHPKVDAKFVRKVAEYTPDTVFVVDIALMEQEFADEAKVPIIWIDHHPPQEIHGVKYYNPRVADATDNPCASFLCYQATKQSLWLAAIGSVGDMQWPLELLTEFRAKYPTLLPTDITTPRDALYRSPVGKLVKIINFILKGTASDAMKYVRVLSRVKDPLDILEQRTPQGQFLYHKFNRVNEHYEQILRDATAKVDDDRLLIYRYTDDKMSFSSDLANEMIYRYPDKIVIMGREKSGEVKCSLRSNDTILPPRITKALTGLHGYGGGHEYASGAVIKAEDFPQFIENLRREVKAL
jgi:single-stranded DNA-specific DHH superfamily exonuclease